MTSVRNTLCSRTKSGLMEKKQKLIGHLSPKTILIKMTKDEEVRAAVDTFVIRVMTRKEELGNNTEAMF